MSGGDLGYSCEHPAFRYANKEIVKRHKREYDNIIYKEIEETGHSDPHDAMLAVADKYEDEYYKIWDRFMRNCSRGDELADYLSQFGSAKEQEKYSKFFNEDGYIGPKNLSLKNRKKKSGGIVTNDMSAEQQRMRQIYTQKALDGDYAGGLALGGLSLGGAVKGSHCRKGATKMQKSGVRRCTKFTTPRKKPAKKTAKKSCKRGSGLALGGEYEDDGSEEFEYFQDHLGGAYISTCMPPRHAQKVKKCLKDTETGKCKLNKKGERMYPNRCYGPIAERQPIKQKRAPSNWVLFLKEYAAANGLSYSEALQNAKKVNGVSALRPMYEAWLLE